MLPKTCYICWADVQRTLAILSISSIPVTFQRVAKTGKKMGRVSSHGHLSDVSSFALYPVKFTQAVAGILRPQFFLHDPKYNFSYQCFSFHEKYLLFLCLRT